MAVSNLIMDVRKSQNLNFVGDMNKILIDTGRSLRGRDVYPSIASHASDSKPLSSLLASTRIAVAIAAFG